MRRRVTLFIFFCFCCLVADQLSKYMAFQQGYAVLNSGIAFGFLAGAPWFFLITGIVALSILAFFFWHHQQGYPLLLLVFGASSNLIDRMQYGGVIDWLIVPGLNIKNNLADWMVVLAVIWLLVVEFKNIRNESK